ncbi:MAG: metal-dependent hydrolase [Candidatus Hodarchaeota archaeon]
MIPRREFQISTWQNAIFLGWPVWSIVIALGWIIALIGDRLIAYSIISNPILIVISDPSIHGLVAFLIIVPLFLDRSPLPYSVLFISTIFAILLDLDHAFTARSFDIQAIRSLSMRPVTHSLVFGILLGGIVSCFYIKKRIWKLALYVVIISIASHVLRDAFDNNLTPWLFPFKPVSVPSSLGFSLFILFSYIHLSFTYSAWTKDISSVHTGVPKGTDNLEPLSLNVIENHYKESEKFSPPQNVFTCFTSGNVKAIYTTRFIGFPYRTKFHNVQQKDTSLEELFKSMNDSLDIRKILQWYEEILETSQDDQEGELFEEFKHAELLGETQFFQIYNAMVLLERFHLMAAQFAISSELWRKHFIPAAKFFATRKCLIELYFPIVESHFHIGKILNQELSEKDFRAKLIKEFKQVYKSPGIDYICDNLISFLDEHPQKGYKQLIQFWNQNADIAAKNCLNDIAFFRKNFANPYKITLEQLSEKIRNFEKPLKTFIIQLFGKTTSFAEKTQLYDSTILRALMFHIHAPMHAFLWPSFVSVAIGLLPDLLKILPRILKSNPYRDIKAKKFIPPTLTYLPDQKQDVFSIDPPAMLTMNQIPRCGIGYTGLEYMYPGLRSTFHGRHGWRVDQYIIRRWWECEIRKHNDHFEALKKFIIIFTQPGSSADERWHFTQKYVDSIDQGFTKQMVEQINSYFEQATHQKSTLILETIWCYKLRILNKLQNNEDLRLYITSWYFHGL